MQWWFSLTLSRRRSLSYRNQTIDFLRKSMDWFLYDNGLHHERVKSKSGNNIDLSQPVFTCWLWTSKCQVGYIESLRFVTIMLSLIDFWIGILSEIRFEISIFKAQYWDAVYASKLSFQTVASVSVAALLRFSP